MNSVDKLLRLADQLKNAAIAVEKEAEEMAPAAFAHGTQPIAIDTAVDGDGVFDTSSGRMVIANGDVEAWAWASKVHGDYTSGERGPWSQEFVNVNAMGAKRIIEAPKTSGQPFFFSNNNGKRQIEIIWTRVAGIWSAPFIMPPVGGFNSDGT